MRKAIIILSLIFAVISLDAQHIYPVAEYSSNADKVQISDIDIQDTILYLPLGEDGLHLLNIAELENIEDLFTYTEYEKRSRKSKVYGTAYKVQVVDNKAFLAFGDLGLKVLDVTDPTMPYVLGTYYRHQEVKTFELYDHFALLGYIEMGMEVIDISNIDNMRMIARKNDKGFTVNNIQLAPPYVVLTGGKRGLKAFKFNEPFHTFKQNQFPRGYLTDNDANKLLLKATTGYLANDFRGLTIYNMGLPLYPVEVKNIKTIGKAFELLIDGNYLYVGCENGIEVFDIRDRENPAKVFEHEDKNKAFKALKMHDNRLFGVYSSGRKDYGVVVFQVE